MRTARADSFLFIHVTTMTDDLDNQETFLRYHSINNAEVADPVAIVSLPASSQSFVLYFIYEAREPQDFAQYPLGNRSVKILEGLKRIGSESDDVGFTHLGLTHV